MEEKHGHKLFKLKQYKPNCNQYRKCIECWKVQPMYDGALTFDALIKPFKKAYNYIFGGPLEIHNKKPRNYPEGTKPPILDKIEDAGHQIFENGPYDLNLFGIRSKNQIPNSFDDWLGCAYQTMTKEMVG